MRYLLLLPMLGALPGLLLAEQLLIASIAPTDPRLWALGAGIAAYVLFALTSRNLHQWHYLVHELAHVLAAVCFFARIDEVYASRTKGGFITYTGQTNNAFISLAPYWLPVLCLLPLGATFVVQASFLPWCLGALAFAYAFHIDLAARQTRPWQTDIEAHGVTFSLFAIAFAHLLVFGTLMAVAFEQSLVFFNNVWLESHQVFLQTRAWVLVSYPFSH